MDFFDEFRYSPNHGTLASPPLSIRSPAARPVRSDVLDEDEAELLARSFAALADPIRLRLLSFIAVGGATRCARATSSNRPADRSRRSAIT